MKSFVTFIAISLTLGFSVKAQIIFAWETMPNPPVVGQTLNVAVGVGFDYRGGSLPNKCEDLLGYNTKLNSEYQILDIYYGLSQVVFFDFCNHIDTFALGVLDSQTEKIVLNSYVVTYDSLNQPDTSAVSSSDTIYLAQIGLPQFEEAKGFEVYPNPAKDKITIKAPHQGLLENLVLLDLSGRKVLSVAHFDPQEILHLPNLPAGIYFLQFEQGGAVFREKILIE